MICHNCETSISDKRTIRICGTCGKPLHKFCVINEGGVAYCDVCYTVKEEGKHINETIVIPDVIRRSYIQTWKDCPYKFYMEVIKGMESEHSIYTQLGVDIHKLVDKLCQDNTYTKEMMIRDFMFMWDSYDEKGLFESTEQKEKMYERAINSIDNAYRLIPEMSATCSSEENIIFGVGEGLPKISATIDRIDEINGELEVTDWKTGRVMVGEKLSSDLQTPLYIYAVRDKYQQPVRKFTYHYLQDGKQRIYERLHDDVYVCRVKKNEYFINLTDAIRETKRIMGQIMKGNFNIPRDTKKMYYTCKTCHIRENEACEGAEVQGWKQYNTGG